MSVIPLLLISQSTARYIALSTFGALTREERKIMICMVNVSIHTHLGCLYKGSSPLIAASGLQFGLGQFGPGQPAQFGVSHVGGICGWLG